MGSPYLGEGLSPSHRDKVFKMSLIENTHGIMEEGNIIGSCDKLIQHLK